MHLTANSQQIMSTTYLVMRNWVVKHSFESSTAVTCMLPVGMLGPGVPDFEQRMRQEEQEKADYGRD